MNLGPITASRFATPAIEVYVRLSHDGFLVFRSEAGTEIYDICAADFKRHAAHWLRQLQSKNWFTADLEMRCLKLAGVVR